MNKRYLKKRIRKMCGDTAVQILLNLPVEVSHPLVIELAQLQSPTLSNVTFAFDRSANEYDDARQYNEARRAYNHAAYKRLNADFMESFLALVSKMNAALTPEQKAANLRSLNS